MTRRSYGGLIALVSAVIAAAGCTAHGSPATTASPTTPITTLQPGEYANVPRACALLSVAAVHSYIPNILPADDDNQADCQWNNADEYHPGDRALFDWVAISLTLYDPVPIPGGLTATQIAISQFPYSHSPDWRAMPDLGDQAYERYDADGAGGAFIFEVRRKNLVIRTSCAPSRARHNKATPQGQRACLDLTRQAVTKI